MKYLFDNNLPPGIAEAFRALDPTKPHVQAHREKFAAEDRDDLKWLPKLIDEGDWVVITQDRKAKSEYEQRAWNDKRLIVFFLEPSWDHQKLWLKVSRLIERWDEIRYLSEKLAPDQYRVPFRGKIRKA